MGKHVLAPRFLAALLSSVLAGGFTVLHAQPPAEPMNYDGAPGGVRHLEEGQPNAMVHATVEAMKQFRAAHGHEAQTQQAGTTSNLSYGGGSGGIGVETTPKIYLVLWGSQWSNDPSGEASILQAFFSAVGGSSWQNSVIQYCQGVASGTVFCNGSGTPAGNQGSSFAGVWSDNASSAPTRPRQSQLANEAVRAAQHFGNTTSVGNASVQYVIATAHGNNSNGFGSQYCAWHSSTSSSYGNVAYTNLPYITDAGASCGANFNGLGAKAGITIVEGHEMAETITDQFPSTGWLDSSGSENGDKCAWISSGQGASQTVMFPNGSSFPVQSLWSNAYNSGAGGCVVSYP
jgi:serine protease